mgnify:FL=1
MSNLLNDLVAEFTQLPGIGTKTAQRLAFHILKTDAEKVNRLVNAIVRAKRDLKTCQICGYFSEEDTCPICQDDRRDKSIVCVVQESSDVITLERIQEYKGTYHVLNGVISPIDGIGPDDINIAGLLNRIRDGEVREVIVATNPNVSGEATALYISKLLKPLGIKVSRLAYGLPAGGSLDYADDITLTKALEGRSEI